MPGITVASEENMFRLHEFFPQDGRVTAPFKGMDWISARLFGHAGDCWVGKTGYAEYPVEFTETEEYMLVMEGKIYMPGVPDGELMRISRLLLDGQCDDLREFILETDGEFLVLFLDKENGDFVIFNDALGRLPLYYTVTPDNFIISREISMVLRTMADLRLDTIGLSQFLLFGYPLGQRTLYEKVNYLPPASFITGKGRNITMKRWHVFNFDEHPNDNLSREENAKALAALFNSSTAARASGNNTLVSLSGGLDSRAVAASCFRQGIPFNAVTYRGHYPHAGDDVEIAGKLAAAFDSEWKVYDISPADIKSHERQLIIKAGQNFLGVSYLHGFLEWVREDFGSGVVYLTGDGGDKLLPDLRPVIPLMPGGGDITDIIIGSNSLFSLPDVADMVGMNEGSVRKNIGKVIYGYPERTLNGKYKHFLIHERGLKWLLEGEDRNRYYFWSTTPFYSIRFFSYAMGCPDSQKKDYGLYKSFLMEMDRVALDIPVAKWGCSMLSPRFKCQNISRRVYGMMPPGIKTLIRSGLRTESVPASMQTLIDFCARSKGSAFPLENIQAISGKIINEKQYYHLLTAALLNSFPDYSGDLKMITGGDASS